MSNWSEGRLKTFITSLLRAGFRKYPAKYETLNAAKRGKKVNPASGRMAEHYECNKCKKHFPLRDVQVDHILPVVCPKEGFQGWEVYISRLFCAAKNLQCLCTTCHNAKSKKEGEGRKRARLHKM